MTSCSRATRRYRRWSTVFPLAVVGLLALVASPLIGGTLTGDVVMWGALAGVGGAVGLVALFVGIARGRVAVVTPIAAVLAAATPVVADLFWVLVCLLPVPMSLVFIIDPLNSNPPGKSFNVYP